MMTLKYLLVGCIASLLLPAPQSPEAAVRDQQDRSAIRVVATQPVYATIAKEIAGDLVSVFAIASANEDPHMVRPRPSYALEIRRADLFLTTGLDLEMWAPVLLDRAGNRNVMEGSRGYVAVHEGITLLDVPATSDRAAGHVHLYGNPHVHIDPLRAIQIARNITTGLKNVASEHSAAFDRGLEAFTHSIHRRLFGDELVEMLGGDVLEELALGSGLIEFLETNELDGEPLLNSLGGWLARAAPLRGGEIICYHKDWSYLEERLGFECVEYLEPLPGIPPRPSHTARVLDIMEQRDISVILSQNYYDRRRIDPVARRSGAEAVIVPLALPLDSGQTYADLVDIWVDSLVAAFRPSIRR